MACKLAKPGFVTIAQLARKLGVSGQAVSQAIRSGRLVAYNNQGEAVPPGYAGRKWLRPVLALEDWHNRRRRYDDPAASGDLIEARARVVHLQGQLLEIRRARQTGELISKSQAHASAEGLGKAIRRALGSIVGWGEELLAAAQDGGEEAISSLLEVKFAELEAYIMGMIAAEVKRL
jgi:hypothetical protein